MLRAQGPRLGAQSLGLKAEGSELKFRVHGSGLKAQGSQFRGVSKVSGSQESQTSHRVKNLRGLKVSRISGAHNSTKIGSREDKKNVMWGSPVE